MSAAAPSAAATVMAVAERKPTIELSMAELRAVTGYAVACAEPALVLFERARPDDRRPHIAIEAARRFAEGAARTKKLRDGAWAAQRAYQQARDQGRLAAGEAARAAVAAAGAAFLHPLAKATQVLHILGSAAHAAYAFELDTGDPDAGIAYLEQTRKLATATVVDVLARYPIAPSGRGRMGALARTLDTALRQP